MDGWMDRRIDELRGDSVSVETHGSCNTICDEVSSGGSVMSAWTDIQRFGDCLCLQQ
jgi:hypothetical protein